MAFTVSGTEERTCGKSHASFSKRWHGNDFPHPRGWSQGVPWPHQVSRGLVSTIAGQVNTSLTRVGNSANPCRDFWLHPVAAGNEPGRENGEKVDGTFAPRSLTWHAGTLSRAIPELGFAPRRDALPGGPRGWRVRGARFSFHCLCRNSPSLTRSLAQILQKQFLFSFGMSRLH